MNRVLLLALVVAAVFASGHALGAETASEPVARGDRLMQQARDRVGHDFAEAEKAYREALESDADDPQARLGMAWVRNSQHRFADGEKWAKRALEVDPNLQQAHALIGDGAVELGDYEKAFDHYQKALDLRTDLGTLGRAAQLLWLTGKPERGRELMERAAAMGGPYPENAAWCLAELANMQRLAGDIAAAERSAEHGMRLAPKNPRVLVAMGAVRANQKRYAEAIECYERSVEIEPTHPALASLVDLYTLIGKPERAREWSGKVRAFHGAHDHSHGHSHSHGAHGHGSHELAKFLADQDLRIHDALHEAEHAYEAFPNVKSADALAWCAFKAGKLELARRMMTKALERKTPDPEFHYHAGRIAAASGQHAEASDHLDRALELNPNFHPIHAEIAREELDRLKSLPAAKSGREK
ncbi:cell surface protein [Haloferula helveola]|uniref:Cell surface protein n=1 Tax=Haloferula helveola TaxID=490095 RepID=A0ABM7RH37_9BACT|nr:cell surface protein [Haloferula helveola]